MALESVFPRGPSAATSSPRSARTPAALPSGWSPGAATPGAPARRATRPERDGRAGATNRHRHPGDACNRGWRLTSALPVDVVGPGMLVQTADPAPDELGQERAAAIKGRRTVRPASPAAGVGLRSCSRGRGGRARSGFLLRFLTYQDGQDVADSGLLAGRFWQREMRLDLIPVAASVLVLDDKPRDGQVRDDPVRAALGDAHPGSDVPQPRTPVLRDPQQDPGVNGQG